MRIILEAKNLRKVYGSNTDNPQTILKDVNVAIREGEFVSVMGPLVWGNPPYFIISAVWIGQQMGKSFLMVRKFKPYLKAVLQSFG